MSNESEIIELRTRVQELEEDQTRPMHQRAWDLLRQMRGELIDQGLISRDEYAWLCIGAPGTSTKPGQGSPAPRRLESYDEHAARLEAAEARVQELEQELGTIKACRDRICASFNHRIDGECQCPYCTQDADALTELAADYEMRLYGAEARLTARADAAEAALLTAQREIEQLSTQLREICEGFRSESLNGVVCSIPDSGIDTAPHRTWCARCRNRWRALFAMPAKLAALAAGPAGEPKDD